MTSHPLVCTDCQELFRASFAPNSDEPYIECGCRQFTPADFARWLPDEMDEADLVRPAHDE